LLGRTDGNGSTFYHADCLGNVTALINSSNILVAQYLYSPFGQVVGKWGPYANLNEMQFSSMPRHSLSGFSMYLYRVYDAGLQRWVSRDPIGECGGVNLYRMNHNNPIDEIDPLGLDNMYGAVSGGTWNNNVPNVTLSMNPIVTPVYHPSIPVLTAAGEEPVSVPPGYTEYVPTGAFQLTTTYNGTDPNSVIMMIAAGYFLGDAAGEGLGAMGGAGFRLFTKCADFTKAADAGAGIKYIGKLDDLQGIPRSQTLLDQLPDLGSARANYYQNSSVLRGALRDGYQIQDASAFRLNSSPDPTLLRPDRTVGQSFLGAERNILDNKELILGPNGIYVPK
jgi:RHS repeat-associated protein